MKKYFILYSLILVATFITSCEKVIDVDLNTEDPKYVIEGFVTKGETVHQVHITRTLNFDENMAFPTVDNATVVISDDAGNSETLTLIAPGLYQTSNLLGVEGRTYTISVSVNGKNFTAKSTLPTEVVLDSVEVVKYVFGLDTVRALVPKRIDQAGVTNYYQYKVVQNNMPVKGVFIQDDQFSDGIENEQPLFGGDFLPNDTVSVTMLCIDKPVYKYLFSIDANTGSTASPANPDSNFGSECLGYFSARTKRTKTIIIPQ
jgi:hypothetical protein